MAASPKRVCWDSCAWIAFIQKEVTATENRYGLCRAVVTNAEQRKIEIATSSLCLVEVCKNPQGHSPANDAIADFFEHEYTLLVPLDKLVGSVARKLMRAGYSGLKPPDAAHLATAIVANADELHTFDGTLLDLNGKLDKNDGTKLNICKPSLGGPPLPLLEAAAQREIDNNASETTPPAAEDVGKVEPAIASGEVQGDGTTTGVRPERSAVQGETAENRAAEVAPPPRQPEGLTPAVPDEEVS